MTLCVAMRYDNQIQIATDSRLNWGSSSADVGVKLMPLVLRLHHAKGEGEDQPRLAYSRVLGLATIGNLPTTYVSKELLGSVLSGIQFAEGVADISMRGIAGVCARIMQSVSKEVCAAIFEQGKGQLVLVGQCLAENIPRAFVLSVTTDSDRVAVTVDEALTDEREAFFGSGASAARDHLANSTHAFPYQVVQAVSRDPRVASVGGNVQFGLVDGEDFRVMGIRAVRVNDDQHEYYSGFFFGGLEVYGGQTLLADTGFALAMSFLNPVEKEIEALTRKGYSPVSNIDHW